MGARAPRLPSNALEEGRGRRGCQARSMRSMRSGAGGSSAPAGHRSPVRPQDNDPSVGAGGAAPFAGAAPSAAPRDTGSSPAAPPGSTDAGREDLFQEEDVRNRDWTERPRESRDSAGGSARSSSPFSLPFHSSSTSVLFFWFLRLELCGF